MSTSHVNDTSFGSSREVTELVLANRRLEASERQYRTLVDNIPEVIWSMRHDASLRFIGANVERVFGFTVAEMLAGAAHPSGSRVHPDDVDRVRSAFAATREEKAPFDVEYRFQHRNGRWIWVHARGAASFDAEGNECVDGVFSDVTARKLLEEQLCHAQKIEVIGQLTAGIAHDFKSLLSVVLANSQYLSARVCGDAIDVVSDIREAAQRALSLTARLLAFARRESAEPAAVDLGHVVEGVQQMLARTLGSSINISVRRAPTLGWICADAIQLEQVIMNLSINARDAMPCGGDLVLSTTNVDVEESFEGEGGPPPGRYVMLSVRDTGCGMDTATRARLFEPFFTTKAQGKGTGLGLSTSYGIVRRFGGHFTVDSAPGRGTTFEIYFPALG